VLRGPWAFIMRGNGPKVINRARLLPSKRRRDRRTRRFCFAAGPRDREISPRPDTSHAGPKGRGALISPTPSHQRSIFYAASSHACRSRIWNFGTPVSVRIRRILRPKLKVAARNVPHAISLPAPSPDIDSNYLARITSNQLVFSFLSSLSL